MFLSETEFNVAYYEERRCSYTGFPGCDSYTLLQDILQFSEVKNSKLSALIGDQPAPTI